MKDSHKDPADAIHLRVEGNALAEVEGGSKLVPARRMPRASWASLTVVVKCHLDKVQRCQVPCLTILSSETRRWLLQTCDVEAKVSQYRHYDTQTTHRPSKHYHPSTQIRRSRLKDVAPTD